MVELKSISVNKRLFPNSPVPPQSSDLEANGDASMDIVMVSECSYNMEDNDTMDINEAWILCTYDLFVKVFFICDG